MLLVGVVELFSEFTTGYWWVSWNCFPGSPRVIGGGRGTDYRVHHGLLVGVVELFTEFTTGYWCGSWNCLPSSPRVIGGGRETVYRVHHGLLVGVVVIGGGPVARSFVFCALFSDSDYPFGVFKLFLFFKLI